MRSTNEAPGTSFVVSYSLNSFEPSKSCLRCKHYMEKNHSFDRVPHYACCKNATRPRFKGCCWRYKQHNVCVCEESTTAFDIAIEPSEATRQSTIETAGMCIESGVSHRVLRCSHQHAQIRETFGISGKIESAAGQAWWSCGTDRRPTSLANQPPWKTLMAR